MNHNNARGYRQVGNSPPDRKLMSKAEIEQRRETLTRLRDLLKQTEKGDEKAVPAIREILDETPDLACTRGTSAGGRAPFHKRDD